MEDVLNPGPFKTFVGEFEVLTSGTVHITNVTPLHVMLNDLKVQFVFHTDTENLTQRVTYAGSGDKTLNVNVFNFNNSLGTGIMDPTRIGIYADRELFCTFFVWTPNLQSGIRIVNYVFYVGPKK